MNETRLISHTLLGVELEALEKIRNYGPIRFINRELSWLAFANRLVGLVEDDSVPLLERTKFLAILFQGLDEFFQVRVAGLKDQLASNNRLRSPDGLKPREQLQAVKAEMDELLDKVELIWPTLKTSLVREGISVVEYSELTQDEISYLKKLFVEDIYPILTPLAVDPSHPFPYISNLSLNLVVKVYGGPEDELRIARVKVPPLVPRFVQLLDSGRYIALEEVISAHADLLFPGMSIGSRHYFRVTRNADIILEEGEADDLLLLVESELRRRRFGRAVRMEIDAQADQDILSLLIEELELHPDDVYRLNVPLALDSLWTFYALDRPELKSPAAPLVPPPAIVDESGVVADIFSVLREHDVLVHHPYESFSTSVEQFISQAADDPDVLAIKQTLYRTSGDSTIVESLVRAAEQGKQVAVLVEVKARFDELANINWARKLEEAGVHVVYGLVGLKTHLKAALVVRKEGTRLNRYFHLGTGNYNAKTAKSYEDFGLLSSDPEIGADLTEVFNMLTGFSARTHYSKLVLAPAELRRFVNGKIHEQAKRGCDGRIVIKVNGLVDPEMVDELYLASQSGVRVDLIVRGICSLRPGLVGLSETITVKSIVGSMLEHSRIYCFGGIDENDSEVYLASADLMSRNLDRRVEAMFPIEEENAKRSVIETLNLELMDDTRSWTLAGDGSWHRVLATTGVHSQRRLAELALDRTKASFVRRKSAGA